MRNITIDDCFDIIKKAINEKRHIENCSFSIDAYMFSIYNEKKCLDIRINPDSIFIDFKDYNYRPHLYRCSREIAYQLTPEDRRIIERLYIDVDELNELQATEQFFNFI